MVYINIVEEGNVSKWHLIVFLSVIIREIREQIRAIRDLPQKDKFRAYATTKMLDKLYK